MLHSFPIFPLFTSTPPTMNSAISTIIRALHAMNMTSDVQLTIVKNMLPRFGFNSLTIVTLTDRCSPTLSSSYGKDGGMDDGIVEYSPPRP